MGSGIGVVLGGAYWLGERAQAADAHARLARLDGAASQGLSSRTDGARIAAVGTGSARSAAAPVFVNVTRVNAPTSRPFHVAGGGALNQARELGCLTDAVYYEARGEDAAGQAAVAQVVINRVRHPAFPKSVCGVVFQRADSGDGCQFSFVCDGSMRHQREPGAWRRAEEVAARALDGSVMSAIGAATHFHAAGVNPGWGPSLLRVAQVGLHVFYRFGHGGFAPQPGRPAAVLTAAANVPPADGGEAGHYILASATTTAAPSAGGAALDAAAAPPKAKTPVAASVAPQRAPDAAGAKTDAAAKAPASEPAPVRAASVS